MIGWLLPAALGGLALVALPIAVHFLRTHRARRVPFPTLRFIAPSRTSAVKFRPPSDLPLLFVRIAIVAAAALAMAQPVLVTPGRIDGWNNRLVRAVVLDSSAGMQLADARGTRPADLAKPLVASEVASAAPATTIETSSLADGLARAAAWLATSPPGRREIVVLSTFRAGSLDGSAVAQVPAGVGLRLVQVGESQDSGVLEGMSPLAPPGSRATQEVRLTNAKTSVTRRLSADEQRGWRVVPLDAGAPGVQRLWRTLAAAGTPAPSPDEPLALAFGPGPVGDTAATFGTDTPRWMLRALSRLMADEPFQQAAAAQPERSSLSSEDRWVTVATDGAGAPLVRVARSSGELLMQVGAPVDSLFGAVAARALLRARAGDAARPDREILRLPAATLAGWSRAAPPIDPDSWRSTDGSEARWLWALALVLLGGEYWLRRSTEPRTIEVRDAA